MTISTTRARALPYLFVILVLVVGRLAYFSEPYGISVDESNYMTFAEVLKNGGTAYVDAVDRKPPVLLWFYQIIGSFFGSWNIHGLHFCFWLWTLFSALLVGYFSSAPFFVGTLTFALMSSAFPREIISSNSELVMLPFLLLSAGLAIRRPQNARAAFLAGVFGALAALSKQIALLPLFILIATWIGIQRKYLSLKIWKLPFFFSLGFIFVVASICFYFYEKNALREFMQYSLWNGVQFVADSRSTVNHTSSGFWLSIFGMLFSWPVLWYGLVLGALAKRKEISHEKILWWAVLIGSFLTIFLSGRYFTHYFLPTIAFLSLLAAEPLYLKWKNSASQKARVWIAIGLLLPFCFYAFINFARDDVGMKSTFNRERQAELSELALKIQKWIPHANDRIIVWGQASQIYILSERGTGARFFFSDFVSGRQPGYHSPDSRPEPQAMEIFLKDLEEKKPAAFIDTSGAKLNDYEFFPPSRFPELDQLLKSNYEIKEGWKGYTIWVNKKN